MDTMDRTGQHLDGTGIGVGSEARSIARLGYHLGRDGHVDGTFDSAVGYDEHNEGPSLLLFSF